MIANDNQILASNCDEVELNKKHNIYGHRFYSIEEVNNTEKKILIDLVVVVGNKRITNTFAQTTQFKEELFIFDQGDEQNEYVFPGERMINNKKVKSLAMKINETKMIYLSRSEAKSIATLLNTYVLGFSLTNLKSGDLRDTYDLC